MRTLIIFLMFVGLIACRSNTNSDLSFNFVQHFESDSVLVNFAGKGSHLMWDLGVSERLQVNFEDKMPDKIIYSGNSSGALFASYYSCHGMNKDSIDRLRVHAAGFDFDEIPSTSGNVLVKKAFFGARLESDWTYLRPKIENLLKDNSGRLCIPKNSVIITAANGDVLDQRVKSRRSAPSIKSSKGDRFVPEGQFNVYSMDTDVKEAQYLGKACTYFVTADVAAIIRQVPKIERLCDIRQISTGRDLLLAVLASIAEPAMLYPVAEADLNDDAIYQSTAFHDQRSDPYWRKRNVQSDETIKNEPVRDRILNSSERFYVGGFVISIPAQDIRRVHPGMRVISTGAKNLSSSVDKVLRTWYSVSPIEAWNLNRYWVNVDFEPQLKITDNDEVAINLESLGASRTNACLGSSKSCKPADSIITKPHHFTEITPLEIVK